MNQKLRKTVCILIFHLAVLVSIPAGAQQFQALMGVPGTTFISPKGETKLGSTTIWTESGLASSVVLHEKNPNNIRLGVVQIELKQGATIKGKSLESVLSRNFISIITEKDQKILWIPFDAIDSLNIKEVSPKNFDQVSIQEEVYGRFRLKEERSSKMENLTLSVNVFLMHPDESGSYSFRGYLLEDNGKLIVFLEDDNPKEIPWVSVKKMKIHRGQNESKEKSSSIPKFLYRALGKWSNVWNEYTIP